MSPPPGGVPPPAPPQRGQKALTALGGGVLVLAVAGGAWALFGRDTSKDKTGAIGPKVPVATAPPRVAGPVVPGKSVAAAPTVTPTSTQVKPVATAPAAATQAPTPAPTVSPTAAVAPPSKPVTTPPPVTAPQQGGTVTKKAFTFRVARGDTLWELTKQALRDTGRSTSNADVAAYVSKLYQANKSTISDPDVIYVGQTISWPASL